MRPAFGSLFNTLALTARPYAMELELAVDVMGEQAFKIAGRRLG